MPNHAPHIAYIGLGSNMGCPTDNLNHAVTALRATSVFSVDAVSDIYRSEPQGLRNQAWFGNMVARIRVQPSCSPEDVLDILQSIENDMGRVRTTVWGPRVIDLDLLTFDELCICSERLLLPHPRMCERAFVLVPLLQLAPGLLIDTQRARDCLARLSYTVDEDRIWQTEGNPKHLTIPKQSGHNH